jgi:glutaredoxin
LALTGCTLSGQKTLSLDAAKAKAEKFINENLVQPGSNVTIKSITDEGGLFKLVIGLSTGQEVTSYLTKDGSKFFPQVIDIAAIENHAANASQASQNNTAVSQVTTKSEKPKVELFVMSYCPYGTQIEKGLLPVLDLLGNKIDFELKFCSYAMHDKKEIDEQLTQYCIQKEQPEKFKSYLYCFLENSKSEECLTNVGVSQDKLASCISATDQQYKVTEKFNNKSAWTSKYPPFDVFAQDNEKYGVEGSPTLVINGQKITSSRDSQSLLKTICSAFNNPPDECNQELSKTAPTPGFGFSGSGASSGANCNQ